MVNIRLAEAALNFFNAKRKTKLDARAVKKPDLVMVLDFELANMPDPQLY